MLRLLPGLVLLLALFGFAPRATAGLFAPEVKPYVAPGRMFTAAVPPSWTVKEGKDPNEVQFYPTGPGDPVLYVRRITVPAGADPIQLALRAIDERLSKMPFFKLLSKRRVTLAGKKAATITGAYAHQGNIQFPRAIEEVYLVNDKEAFILHFECFEHTAGRFAAQLNGFYESFIPRPGDSPTVKQDRPFPEVEKMPF